jgi:hypothetical protein
MVLEDVLALLRPEGFKESRDLKNPYAEESYGSM